MTKDIANRGLVCERDKSGYYYIGIYDVGGHPDFEDWAANYIGDLVTKSEIRQVLDDLSIDKTERDAIVKARVGQGKFRKNLEDFWENKCAVTGCSIRELLRASHIKHWCRSNNRERLDVFNGLLLVANIDALFDAGLISFHKDGSIKISKNMGDDDRKMLSLDGMRLSRPLSPQHEAFMEMHRRRVP